MRWHCRFADDFDQGNHMHFSHLLANRADNRYSAFGQAVEKPAGDVFSQPVWSTGVIGGSIRLQAR